jgi:hypothetical protein
MMYVTQDDMAAMIRRVEINRSAAHAQAIVQQFIEDNANSMTEEARAQAMAFLRRVGSHTHTDGPPMSPSDAFLAVHTFFDQIVGADGLTNRQYITRGDLQTVIDSPVANSRLKTAARYVLANFSRVDDAAGMLGKADGLISKDDLATAAADSDMTPKRAIDAVRDNFDYFDWASGTFGIKAGWMDKSGLEYALKDPKALPEAKAAARYLLAHPELLPKNNETVTLARSGAVRLASGPPGTTTRSDLDKAAVKLEMDPRLAVQTIHDNFEYFDYASGTWGFVDSYVGKKGLEYALRDSGASPQMKAAAEFLLEHPEVLDRLGLSGDGSTTKDALAGWIRNQPAGVIFDTLPYQISRDDGVGGIVVALPDVWRTEGPGKYSPELNDSFQNQIDDILGDPSLTIEDQVCLVIMLIMKEMDREIERQMKHITELQKQAGKDKDKKDTSIDIETMKLKRLVDKRSQMFDMLRQIIDRYNQTAKGIIDTVGR